MMSETSGLSRSESLFTDYPNIFVYQKSIKYYVKQIINVDINQKVIIYSISFRSASLDIEFELLCKYGLLKAIMSVKSVHMG